MRTNVLAEQLTALAAQGDGDSLVIEARSGNMLFRFGCASNASGRTLIWEAASLDPRQGATLSESQTRWLERAGFHSADGRMMRKAAMPYTIEAARLIADLTAFLLEKALGLSTDAPVWISRRTADARRRGPAAAQPPSTVQAPCSPVTTAGS